MQSSVKQKWWHLTLLSEAWLVACSLLGCHLILPFGSTAPDATADHAAAQIDGQADAARDDFDASRLLADHGAVRDGPSRFCTPWSNGWTFGGIENLGAVNSADDEYGPFLTADGRTLYFGRQRPEAPYSADIYWATRVDAAATFATASPFDAVNDPTQIENAFVLSADGLTAFFVTSRDETAANDIWWAKRTDVGQEFQISMFSSLATIKTPAHEGQPFPSADGRTLYFTRCTDLDDCSGDFWSVSLVPTPGKPEVLSTTTFPNVNTTADEECFSLSADQLVLVFSRKPLSGGVWQIYYSTRSRADQPFSSPQLLPGVNGSGANNGESFLTPDGCTLYFASDRPGGSGHLDLYRARFTP